MVDRKDFMKGEFAQVRYRVGVSFARLGMQQDLAWDVDSSSRDRRKTTGAF